MDQDRALQHRYASTLDFSFPFRIAMGFGPGLFVANEAAAFRFLYAIYIINRVGRLPG